MSSDSEAPAFHRGAWRGWGLAVVFIAGILAFELADLLAAWAFVVVAHPEARSLAGFASLYVRVRSDPGLLASYASSAQILVIVLVRSVAAVGTVYALRGLLPAESMRALGFVRPAAEQLTFGAVAALMALSAGAIVNIVWVRLVGYHPDPWARIFAAHQGPWSYLLDVSQGSLVSPIAEETLFRGVLFAGLAQRMSPVVAGIASATLFGLAHLNAWGLPSYITSGLVFAWVYFRTRNIWASITTHAVLNWMILALHYAAHANHPG